MDKKVFLLILSFLVMGLTSIAQDKSNILQTIVDKNPSSPSLTDAQKSQAKAIGLPTAIDETYAEAQQKAQAQGQLLSKDQYTLNVIAQTRAPGQKINRHNKYNTTDASVAIGRPQTTSFTQQQIEIKVPSGSTIFPQQPTLATKFDSLMTAIQNKVTKNEEEKNKTGFLIYFKKIHFTALHQLYEYLLSIYANFNMTHPGVTEVNNKIIVDLLGFLDIQREKAINEKTLMVNHLMNLIESQREKLSKAVDHLRETMEEGV